MLAPEWGWSGEPQGNPVAFQRGFDGPPGGELRRGIESHCADCAICGPNGARPPPRADDGRGALPPGFADRVMAALPPVTAPRREAMPFVAAGLLVAGGLLAFQLAYVSDSAPRSLR